MGDWDAADHPRHPAGASDSRGGEFRDKAGGWAEAIAARLVGRTSQGPWADLPEFVTLTEHQKSYGEIWNETTIHELPDGSQLRIYSHPEAETGAVGVLSADGERFSHMYDASPRSLRVIANLINSADMVLMPYDLREMVESEGLHEDGSIVRVLSPSGEGVGLLPGGRFRWYSPGNWPPVDFEDRDGLSALREQFESFADTIETDIENFNDQDEDEEDEDEEDEEGDG